MQKLLISLLSRLNIKGSLNPLHRFGSSPELLTESKKKKNSIYLWLLVYWKAETLLCNKGLSSQGYGFSSGHVWMWELDSEESWVLKNWCFWTVVLEKTPASPLECKEIQPVLSEGGQPWVFFGGNDAKAEAPVLWPPHVKSWLIGKYCFWEGLGAGGKGDNRGWDGWMASPTWWTWVWVNSGSWWWTGRPGMLRFMGLQRVGHHWGTELNWTELVYYRRYTSATVKWKRYVGQRMAAVMGNFSAFFGCINPSTSMSLSNEKLSRFHPLGVFKEVSLYGHDD